DERARLCPPAQSSDRIPQRLEAAAPTATWTFDELRFAIRSACASCHLTPAATGGLSYTDAYAGTAAAPGLDIIAAQMAEALVSERMPPAELRLADPAGFRRLGHRLQAWIAAGKPEAGEFPLPGETVGSGQQLPAAIAAAMTDLGDCVPVPQLIGQDQERDAMFASATELPAQLDATDLVTLDAYLLAQRGTVAFDVEYPLWADNARKGRWVHVPSIVDSKGTVTPQAITLDPTTGTFVIPENTRFYKTFFKQVKSLDGAIRYRKVETRLIVVRRAPAEPLFGTYLWDDAEQAATLHAAPYRNGEPFKDALLSLETDETTHTRRTYAVPGAQRCVECHQGSESDSFILGFTPLQLHRRAVGEGGRETQSGADELSQLARLASYGVIAGITPETAPRLESSREGVAPRNVHELRFQGYTTGNCGHCHSPKGFATRQNPALTMNLAPGGNVFQFPGGVRSIYPGGGSYVTPGKPAQSLFYQRVSQNTHLEGLIPIVHMPLHTPGLDCDAVTKLGRWITSVPDTGASPETIAAALAAADTFDAGCREPDDVTWLEEDFSDPPVYVPRRADWNDPTNGIPPAIRAQQFTPALQEMASTPIANGYWIKKSGCRFPTVTLSPDGLRPWMTDEAGVPKRPFGEIFYQTPGAAYFTAVCSKCHGPRADAETGVAKTILYITGGRTRVANLRDGLFGRQGGNLATFDVVEPTGPRNLAGNYLIWMASGGTNAYFPPELEPIVGSHGGNMLNLVREACGTLLPGHSEPLLSSYYNYEIYAKVCAFDNPILPALGFQPGTRIPLDGALQSAWLDRAAQNAGWMLFRFLSVDGASGNWPLTPNQCEVPYPANGR
ncbi:MAG: hypothetical protein H7138_23175, partial [Myxococcales bacterium]|nr:hypothetical protein [Myxococcales bacterium]